MAVENPFRAAIQESRDQLILGIGGGDWQAAEDLLQKVQPHIGMASVNSLALRKGFDFAVETIEEQGFRIMADLKFKDTPTSLSDDVREVTLAGASLITVHADSGPEVLRAAIAARDEARQEIRNPYKRADIERIGGLVGSTLLTSQDYEDIRSIYKAANPEKLAVEFARMALDCGLEGVFCSIEDLRAIRKVPRLDWLICIVAGITPVGVDKPEDQKHKATPAEAMRAGADFLLVKRAITNGPHGVYEGTAARRIIEEMERTPRPYRRHKTELPSRRQRHMQLAQQKGTRLQRV